MNTDRITLRLCLTLAILMFATALPAQRRSTTRRSKKRTTAVAKPQKAVAILPVDSLVGRVYAGKVGQTVVDFFGSRTTYGDVTQQIYIWHDSIAVINQRDGSVEAYHFLPYTLSGSTLSIGAFRYTTLSGGATLEMQKTTENNEVRQGTLSRIDPSMMVNALFLHGKYLDGMTIQTEEDKANALTCLSIAAEYGRKDAQDYLYSYYKKRADRGDTAAVKYLLKHETSAGNYAEAHRYCDKLIANEPQSAVWLCEKGLLYIMEGKMSDAKKIYKKVKKLDEEYYDTAAHPFLQRMRDGR